MKTIKLPCFGIEINVDGEGGSINSDLHEENEDNYNIAMDALESLILAHAVAGIDVASPAYLEGIETAVQACANGVPEDD